VGALPWKFGESYTLGVARMREEVKPEVGMGATEVIWTDRHASTVIFVSSNGKTVRVQQDKATRVDGRGMSDSQTYEFERDPYGRITVYTLRKNGVWKRQGSPMNERGGYAYFGHRSEYYDFSF
jgi:hypothetical protein